MKKILLAAFVFTAQFIFAQQPHFFATTEQPVNPNGVLDRVEELVNRVYHQPMMNDGTKLWLDVTYPEFRDSMDIQGLQLHIGRNKTLCDEAERSGILVAAIVKGRTAAETYIWINALF